MGQNTDTVSQEIQFEDGDRMYAKYTIEYKGTYYMVAGDRPFDRDLYFRRIKWNYKTGEASFWPLDDKEFDDLYPLYKEIERIGPAGEMEHYRIHQQAAFCQEVIECAPTLKLFIDDDGADDFNRRYRKTVLVCAIGLSLFFFLKQSIAYIQENYLDIFEAVGDFVNKAEFYMRWFP